MTHSRRTFLSAASAAIAVSSLSSGSTSAEENNAKVNPLGALTTHELPQLNFPYNALEPFIDAQTMELHHSKHHAAYVKGLNEAEAALAKARASGDYSLIQYWSKKAAFNGGGHALHTLFWKTLAPHGRGGGGEPEGALLSAIDRDFGGLVQFKAQFSAAAAQVEGAGWAILHLRRSDDRLIILQAENQHKLASWDTVPLLALDVWEHAYYLKYQNKRPDYVAAWWNVVNWQAVEQLYKSAKK